MLTLIAIILTAIITTIITRKMNHHRITDLKKSHKDELEVQKAKWFSDGFDDGRSYAGKECKLMKIVMDIEEAKKYPCSH